MPKCVKFRRKKRMPCIGDMMDEITLQDRKITPPTSGVDATEQFTTANADLFAMVETVTGEMFFDGTGPERPVTHRFTIEFIDGITSETWILFNNDRFDILDVEDYEERHTYMRLRASNRGIDTNAANQA